MCVEVSLKLVCSKKKSDRLHEEKFNKHSRSKDTIQTLSVAICTKDKLKIMFYDIIEDVCFDIDVYHK